MAEVIWTAPALSDLDTIADYIALDNPEAAKLFAGRCLAMWSSRQTIQKAAQSREKLKGWRYRQIVEPPCRVFYRQRGISRLYPVRHARRAFAAFQRACVPQQAVAVINGSTGQLDPIAC